MTETSEVRVATPADEAQIIDLCKQLHAENGTHSRNDVKLLAMVRRCIAQDGGIMGVIGDPHDLKGVICLLIDQIWFSDEYQILELFNFVRADSRKSNYAKQLISYAKRCADETECDLTIGIISNIRTEAKIRLYSRQLPEAGRFFIYRPTAEGGAIKWDDAAE